MFCMLKKCHLGRPFDQGRPRWFGDAILLLNTQCIESVPKAAEGPAAAALLLLLLQLLLLLFFIFLLGLVLLAVFSGVDSSKVSFTVMVFPSR